MINKKKAVILSILIAAIMLVSLLGCSKQEMTKIRLNEVTHSIFYAPQYVAINQGFFKEVDTGNSLFPKMPLFYGNFCDTN